MSIKIHLRWRLEEFRKIKLKVDEDYNAQTLSNDKYTELTKMIFGGIPAFYSIGDVNQLPPVAMKSIADDCLPCYWYNCFF